MRNHIILFIAVVVILAGCAVKAPQPVTVRVPSRQIDYLSEVKPLLDKRCVVCHSCYNSPCQLKPHPRLSHRQVKAPRVFLAR